MTNRVKIIYVDVGHIVNLLFNTHRLESIPAPIIDLPPNTTLERWWPAQDRNAFAFVLSNPNWPIVEPGELPTHDEYLQQKIVEILKICIACKQRITPGLVHNCNNNSPLNKAWGNAFDKVFGAPVHAHEGGTIPNNSSSDYIPAMIEPCISQQLKQRSNLNELKKINEKAPASVVEVRCPGCEYLFQIENHKAMETDFKCPKCSIELTYHPTLEAATRRQ